MLAYLIGLLWPWIAFRTFILFWIHEPRKQFITLRVVRTPLNDTLTTTWQSYQYTTGFTRAFWVADLFLDFRAVNWCYSANDGTPCKLHLEKVQKKVQTIPRHTSQFLIIFARVMLRLSLNLIVLDIMQVSIIPYFRSILNKDGIASATGNVLKQPWYFTTI